MDVFLSGFLGYAGFGLSPQVHSIKGIPPLNRRISARREKEKMSPLPRACLRAQALVLIMQTCAL
jgi:hypothetical protein